MQIILTLNSGSSSIKFSLYQKDLTKIYGGIVDSITENPRIKILTKESSVIYDKNITFTDDPYEASTLFILDWIKTPGLEIIAAGHRIVHGGTKYRSATKLTPEILKFLETFIPLAPLHQPYNLNGVKILAKTFPKLFQVACFDTAFHTTNEPLTQLFAIPKKYTDDGVIRYGFHGLSYEYITKTLPNYLPSEKLNGRFIILHLGQGASMCAIKNQKSLATSLGFSALDGIPMGTRCGNIDPGVILHFLSHYKLSYDELTNLLFKESGLLGVSGGISSDMRTLLAKDDENAKLAIDLFTYRINGWIGMLTAELEGLDGLIFTAGIGENSAEIRAKICERAAWLGAKIDLQKNLQNSENIAAFDSKISLYVIPTNEEKIIAEHTQNLLLAKNDEAKCN